MVPPNFRNETETAMPSLIDNVTNDDDESELEAGADPQPGKKEDEAETLGERASKDGTKADEDPDAEKSGCFASFLTKFCAFYWQNEFLILIVCAILLARAYPPLGATYLAPQYTATWIAVMFIFLLAGLGLKTEEFAKAFQRIYFNTYVMLFSFGVDSSIVFGISRLVAHYNIINQGLADGMVIAACLPLTINMCVVLTKASGGDEASSIFNSAFGNLVGVFLSPALILGYIGVSGEVKVLNVFFKLAIRVLLPIIVGQLLKYFCPPVNDFVKTYKPKFKKLQMYSLVFIVYCVFCKTFGSDEASIPIGDIFLMILFIGISLTILMLLAWYSLRLFFREKPKLRIMGLYGCTHKTVAMGVPLINAIYEGDPNIAMYTLPLLIWHPMQLIVGTFLSPRLLAWVESYPVAGDKAGSGDDSNESGETFAEKKVVVGVASADGDDDVVDDAVGDANSIKSGKSIEMDV